jgi:cell division protein FtsX
MLESDDLPVLPIGIAIGVAVILVVLIALGLICGLLGFVINSSGAVTTGLISLAISPIGG